MSAPAAITPAAATSIPRDFGGEGGGGGVGVFLEGFDISKAFYRDQWPTLKFSRHGPFWAGIADIPAGRKVFPVHAVAD